MPIVTGSHDNSSGKQNTEVQSKEVGLNFEAAVDGESLHSKLEQTSVRRGEIECGAGPHSAADGAGCDDEPDAG